MAKTIFLFALICIIGCKKSPTPNQEEENLVIELDPPISGTLIKSLGSTYNFNLIVKSKLPPQGVTIKINVTKDSDNSLVYSQATDSPASTTGLSINNLPFNEITTVQIQVTSKSKATNSANLSFKLAKK